MKKIISWKDINGKLCNKECEIDKNFKIIKDNRMYCAYDSLKKLGIPMLDSNNKYRSLSDILVDLSKKFNSTYRNEKYRKRMVNRNKLYNKLQKLGRRL
ncbi:phage tail tape measure protein [Clostridium sp. ZBS18]|uniref:phage tail tape measure protein n=1 Tax=Clostridium sp. ZBS18 TaxID=2949967 RepID=UPI00207AD294|nr:phage tail tape measure protein [Clostridium sp. ZBS18]